MGKISNYEKKFHTLVNRQGGCCAIAAANGEFATPTELHHARCHDPKWSRMKWPLFIDSIVTLMAVSHEWHMKRGGFGHWPERQIEWFEARMRNNPVLAARWNCGDLQRQLRTVSSSREKAELS